MSRLLKFLRFPKVCHGAVVVRIPLTKPTLSWRFWTTSRLDIRMTQTLRSGVTIFTLPKTILSPGLSIKPTLSKRNILRYFRGSMTCRINLALFVLTSRAIFPSRRPKILQGRSGKFISLVLPSTYLYIPFCFLLVVLFWRIRAVCFFMPVSVSNLD